MATTTINVDAAFLAAMGIDSPVEQEALLTTFRYVLDVGNPVVTHSLNRFFVEIRNRVAPVVNTPAVEAPDVPPAVEAHNG